MTVLSLRRPFQIRSCTNSGRYPVTVWVGGQPVTYHLCGPHMAEHRTCGAA